MRRSSLHIFDIYVHKKGATARVSGLDGVARGNFFPYAENAIGDDSHHVISFINFVNQFLI